MRLAVEKGLRRVDALGLEHVVAHGSFDEHGEVAAGSDRDRSLRHFGVEDFAIAVVAVDATEAGFVVVGTPTVCEFRSKFS